MTAIIDHAARAAYEAYERHSGGLSGPWEETPERNREIARDQVRAVLLALTEAYPECAFPWSDAARIHAYWVRCAVIPPAGSRHPVDADGEGEAKPNPT